MKNKDKFNKENEDVNEVVSKFNAAFLQNKEFKHGEDENIEEDFNESLDSSELSIESKELDEEGNE